MWKVFQNCLFSQGFPTETDVWIGLNSIAFKNNWVWADGTLLQVDRYIDRQVGRQIDRYIDIQINR